jgi:hypothetical protein
MAFEEYTVRVALDVQRQDDFGIADEVQISYAEVLDALSPAEAARIAADKVPARVADRLKVS